jgi:hypothetical protein
MRMVSEGEIAYFQDITARYPHGAVPSPLKFEAARAAECHENAEAFFKYFPDHPIQRGWLVAEIGGAPGFFRLVAHSVNSSPDGTLVDTTSLADADRRAYRFVFHIGDEERFSMLRQKYPEIYFPFMDTLSVSMP